ncbi:hypothetical protein HHI36_024045 [Cryptolaemus montrouzieri]|uniref:Uncharacterized protein n=1 Tax=Cryptolaemus montrouzieri TaxID=559131 RepID=A0ABD2NII0_9CUCU
MKFKTRTNKLASVKAIGIKKHGKTLKKKVLQCKVPDIMEEKTKKRRSRDEMQAEIDALKKTIAGLKELVGSITTERKRKKVGDDLKTNNDKEFVEEMHVSDDIENNDSNTATNIACTEFVGNPNHIDENLETVEEDFITVIRKRNREKREQIAIKNNNKSKKTNENTLPKSLNETKKQTNPPQIVVWENTKNVSKLLKSNNISNFNIIQKSNSNCTLKLKSLQDHKTALEILGRAESHNYTYTSQQVKPQRRS